ncbi:MAG: iron-siderophore ABC transporter substrate-binding protein [Cyanobacteria bacterium P01_A01_bin.68]
MLIIKQKVVRLINLSILTTFLICGCNNSNNQVSENKITTPSLQSNSTANCRKIKHDFGLTKICSQPQKVVVLSPHTLDLLLSLDLQPAGYAAPINLYREEKYNNPAQQIPYLGTQVTTKPINLGTGSKPSLERLTALKPDLIIGDAGSRNYYSVLSKIAPTLLWNNRTKAGKWQENIQKIAKALGREQQAQQAIDNYEKQIAATRVELAPVIATHPKLLVLGTDNLQKNISIVNPNSYLGEILQGIGFKLVSLPSLKNDSKPLIPISIETLPKLNQADTIIVMGYNLNFGKELQSGANKQFNRDIENNQSQPAKNAWKKNAIAQSLSASKENRVYFATYYRWNGLNGPIGTELVIEQLREFLLSKDTNNDTP